MVWGLKFALFTKKTCNKKVVVMAEGGHEVDRWLIHGVESFKVLFVLHLPCRLFVAFFFFWDALFFPFFLH